MEEAENVTAALVTAKLVNSFPVVDCLMEIVPAKVLNTLTQVCKLWNSVARKAKKRRKPIATWTSFPMNGFSTNIGLKNRFKVAFGGFMMDTYVEPMNGFLFIAASFASYIQPTSNNKLVPSDSRVFLARKKAIEEYFESQLPQKCKLNIVVSYAAIGTSSPQGTWAKNIDNNLNFSSVFFPAFAKFKIHRISIDDFMKNPRNFYQYTTLRPYEPIKCILGFWKTGRNSRESPTAAWNWHMFLEILLQTEDMCLAVGSSSVMRSYYRAEEEPHRNSSYVLAFTGAGVNAASIVIPCSMKENKIITKLQVLDNVDWMKRGQCIAFAFIDYYNRRVAGGDFEVLGMKVFRKMFPSVPLFGMVSFKVNGFDYVPGYHFSPEHNYRMQAMMQNLNVTGGGDFMFEVNQGKNGSFFSVVFVLVSVKTAPY